MLNNEIVMLTNRLNSFGINDDSDHRGFRFPNSFPFASKNRLFYYCLDSGKFSMRVSGEKKIGHPVQKSAVMSETG
jgi:hypothetical protein